MPSCLDHFDFRVLRENRRVIGDTFRADELEEFHGVLTDISWGIASQRVRDFMVRAYVKGAAIGCAERAEVEGALDFKVFPATHTFIMNRKDVAEEVVHFLEHGEFMEREGGDD